MNHQRQYNLLVAKAKARDVVPPIIEKHHILPKCMGGTNAKENIVLFTPKEHYVAHHLLWKIHKTTKMHYAFWLMVNKTSTDSRRVYRITSRVYEKAKIQHGINVSKLQKGRKRSEESRKKSSIALKGKPCWAAGKTGIHSTEGLENIRKARTGKKDSDETKRKKSQSHTGITRGPSPLKGRSMPIGSEWLVICPYCNKSGVKWNMERYHFENCKIKEKENLPRLFI